MYLFLRLMQTALIEFQFWNLKCRISFWKSTEIIHKVTGQELDSDRSSEDDENKQGRWSIKQTNY